MKYYSILCILLLTVLPGWLDAQTQKTDGDKNGEWFKITEVSPKVWCIDDNGGANIYLVEGNEKAMLIDAGTGVADLRECIHALTALPLVVVNTHGHLDHSGSDYQFDTVYGHPADFDMIRSCATEDFHRKAIERAREKSPGLASRLLAAAEKIQVPSLIPVHDSSVFDLGGRHIEVIEVAGHTGGSICLLDREDKLLFTGDNNNVIVWLFLEGSLPIEEYLKVLEKLQTRSADYTRLLPGHGVPIDNTFIAEQIACANSIISGECTGEPYKTFVDYARICRYKRAAIAFDPSRIREPKR